MKKLQIFALAFDDAQFESIPVADNIIPVNLSKLQLIKGIENSNQLCEHRIFLSNLPTLADAEYFAFVSWRHHEKYPDIKPITEFENLELTRDIIYVSDIATNWFEVSINHHPGIGAYINELKIISQKYMLLESGFWSNQFICSATVYFEWEYWFRKYFKHFHYKYGLNYNYSVIPEHENRKAGVFYERFSSLYFSNRADLLIKQIPDK